MSPYINRKTKNMLNLVSLELKKRQNLPIKEAYVYENGYAYPKCPNCEAPIEGEYISYCDRCGQKLKWTNKRKIKYICKWYPPKTSSTN